MRLVKEIMVGIPHEVGSLAALTRVLAGAEINILGFGLEVIGGLGMLRLVVDRPSRAAAALGRHGYEQVEHDVLAVGLSHRRGSLLELSEAFTAAGLGINYCYTLVGYAPTSVATDERAVLIVNCPEPARASALLASRGSATLFAPHEIGQHD